MGWYSVYKALTEGYDVKEAIATNMPGQGARAFDVAAQKIIEEGNLPTEKHKKAKIIYWFQRYGYPNPYKPSPKKSLL